ncbi:MAG: hypothetical protein ABI432_02085 [Flavobacteriales bacterium]
MRKRIRNAVVAAGVLFRDGSTAYKDKHGQVDLFTGSAASRRPPEKHAMHIAKRLMGSDEKSLRVCLKRVEKVVYAYNAAGHARLPSDRILDDTIEWAFAVRVRKPRPYTGEWLLGKHVTSEAQLPWAAVEAGFMAGSLWPGGCDVPWYAWCWKLMAETGLTEQRSAAELDLVRLRAVALQHIYADYCIMVFNERRAWTGEKLYVALGGNRLAWEPQAFMAQRMDVAGAILGHYKRLDDELRNKGRLQLEGGASEALLEDLETSLPLMGDTLKEHFDNPATWVNKPGVSDLRKYNRARFDKKMENLRHWLVTGMVTLPVKTTTRNRVVAKP